MEQSMLSSNLFFRQIRHVPTLPPSLRSVNLWHCELTSLDWTQIAPFLRLPSLSSIHCSGAIIEEVDLNENHDDDGDNDDDDDSGDHGVEIIHLEGCVVHAKVIAALVKSTRRLRSLIYQQDDTSPYSVFAELLGRALRKYARDTLENLELDFSVDELDFIEPSGSLGSLRDFGRLKHVTAPLFVLLGEPSPGLTLELSVLLPQSLTSLSLWVDPEWEIEGWELVVVRLLQNKQENVPLLERLHVEGYFDTSLEERIRETCVLGQLEVTFSSSRKGLASIVSFSPIPTHTSF
jgi:hypothetical protein